MKKLLEYAPLLIPVIFALILLGIVFISVQKSYGAVINTSSNYLSCIFQIDLPVNDIRIVILDLRGVVAEPFGSYITKQKITEKPFAVTELKISTNEIVDMKVYADLAKAKDETIKVALKYNKKLKWEKPEKGEKINDWWMRAVIE